MRVLDVGNTMDTEGRSDLIWDGLAANKETVELLRGRVPSAGCGYGHLCSSLRVIISLLNQADRLDGTSKISGCAFFLFGCVFFLLLEFVV